MCLFSVLCCVRNVIDWFFFPTLLRMLVVALLLFIVTLLVGLYFRLRKHYNYWKHRGVVSIDLKIPLGTLHPQFFGKADAGTVNKKWYDEYHRNQGLKYVGAFRVLQPTLMVFDLDLCKHILTKDFNHFVSRDFIPVTHEYISKHLFALDSQEWKDMRVTLTPTFTSGKIKNMFFLMEKCTEQLLEETDKVVLEEGEFEVKDLISRFTTDVIATCAFGLEVNSIKNKDNEFNKIGQLIFEPKRSLFVVFLLHKCFPKFAKWIKLNFYNQQVSDFLYNIVKDTVKYRAEHNVTRNDFIDLLLNVKTTNSNAPEHSNEESHREEKMTGKLKSFSNGLTLEQMTAQAFVFFAAGFETAASTTSFSLYELARNPQIQERLQREIDLTVEKHGGRITYQGLQEMTFLDQVLNETLRMYASLPLLTRVCTETYHLPGTHLLLEKGVRVNIPVYAFHHDPTLFPEPSTFHPDRFSELNSKGRHPYAFLPFGEGPRMCIGTRFGKLQVKIALASLLSKYSLSPSKDTPSSIQLNPFIVFTTPLHPFKLKLHRRTRLSQRYTESS